MELKHEFIYFASFENTLLIVPYGIETKDKLKEITKYISF